VQYVEMTGVTSLGIERPLHEERPSMAAEGWKGAAAALAELHLQLGSPTRRARINPGL
jgi:hypothetical protein